MYSFSLYILLMFCLWLQLFQHLWNFPMFFANACSLIRIFRIQRWSSLFSFSIRNAFFWAIFVEKAKMISLSWNFVDTYCFFLVLLNKTKMLGEAKVSGVIQGNEGGRWVEDFLLLPQGFRNFSSVFFCSRCNWIVGSSINVLTDLILFRSQTVIKYTINFNC